MMEQQQVNVQELQRLNDAITMTMEAIRRVVPQLGVLSQLQNPYSQLGVPQLGFGNPWQADPLTQAYVQGHAHALRHILSQVGGGVGLPGVPQQFGAPWQQPQQYGVPQQFGAQQYGAQQYGVPWQHQQFGASPFVNLQQRPF
ncbi:MAG TPA: hypothetical protein VFF06_21385 [Polyangia bacterium]|nr:hypothetical protein [Polyangia bacterium]